jgi:hypothetical protein
VRLTLFLPELAHLVKNIINTMNSAWFVGLAGDLAGTRLFYSAFWDVNRVLRGQFRSVMDKAGGLTTMERRNKFNVRVFAGCAPVRGCASVPRRPHARSHSLHHPDPPHPSLPSPAHRC